MTRRSILIVLTAWLIFLPAATLHARDAGEDARIEALLQHVATLQGATFIRSGKSYDPKTAAAHLRMKLGKAGKRVKTAENFIDGCATKSYLSGKPYFIQLADGTRIESGKYLHKQLDLIDKKKGK